MKRKTKKSLSRLLCLAMTAVFLAAVPAENAKAAEANAAAEMPQVLEASVFEVPVNAETPGTMTTFAQCFINVKSGSDGMLIEINTGVVGKASVIGVKDIKVQKKVWYGWSTVATSTGGELTDATSMVCSIRYANAEKGETYRILCTHYANVDRYEEFEADSGEFVFTY